MPQTPSEPTVTPEEAPTASGTSAEAEHTADAEPSAAAVSAAAIGGAEDDRGGEDGRGAVRTPRVWGLFPKADAETRAVLHRDALPIGVGALLAVTALVLRDGFSTLLPAHAVFAALAAALTALDLRLRRLPDALTLPAYPVLLALLALAGDGSALLRALLAALVLTAGYYALAFFGGAGYGDVKAAGTVGLVLGCTGWHTVLAGTLYASLLAAVLAVALLVSRRASRRTQIPFGPFMTGGALLALLL